MICGHCKMTGVDAAHVKLCKSLTPEKRQSLKGKRFSQPVTRPNNTTATTRGTSRNTGPPLVEIYEAFATQPGASVASRQHTDRQLCVLR